MGMNDKKQKRLQILRQINSLTENNCQGCELDGSDYCSTKCDIGIQLMEMGKQLNLISGKQNVIKQLLAKGEGIKKADILKLLSLEVTNNQIRQAMNLSKDDYEESLIDLGVKERKRNMPRQSKINMTIEEFVQFRFIENLAFKTIANKYDVAESAITYWKKIHEEEIEEKKKELGIFQKTSREIMDGKKRAIVRLKEIAAKADSTKKPHSTMKVRLKELEAENEEMKELLRLWL